MQWTGCHGEERHGGDRGCGGCNRQGIVVRRDMGGVRGCGGCNGQGVMVRRDMELTEVVEDAMDSVLWMSLLIHTQGCNGTGCHGEERHGGDNGGGGCNGQGVMVRRDMEVTEVVEDAMDSVYG